MGSDVDNEQFLLETLATKCKECYFDRLVIEFAMFITMPIWSKVCMLYMYEV